MARPTLVLIHGLLGSLGYFQADARIQNAHALPIDLLGYGVERAVDQANLSLRAQAEHVAAAIRMRTDGDVWILAHSMGGAVATLLIDRYPERIRGLINHEGNFTLKDAFWSGSIARKNADDWAEEFRALQSDPVGWLARSGIEATPETLAAARHTLDNQPASTVHAMARAIVQETNDPAYLDAVRRIVGRGLPIHLIAGARSAGGWDVPGFVRSRAASDVVMPGCGHLSMLEDPAGFCAIVDRIFANA